MGVIYIAKEQIEKKFSDLLKESGFIYLKIQIKVCEFKKSIIRINGN